MKMCILRCLSVSLATQFALAAAVIDETMTAPVLTNVELVEDAASDPFQPCPGSLIDNPQQMLIHNGWRGAEDYAANVRFGWTDSELVVRVDVTDDVYKPASKNADGNDGDSVRISLAQLTCGPDRTAGSRGIWTVVLLPRPDSDACECILEVPSGGDRSKFGNPGCELVRTIDGYSMLLRLPYEKWDAAPRNSGSARVQVIYNDADDRNGIDHQFSLFPVPRNQPRALVSTTYFGKLRFTETLWLRAVPRDFVFTGGQATFLVDSGNLTERPVKGVIRLENTSDENIIVGPIDYEIKPQTTQQAVPLEIDMRQAPTGTYRLRTRADVQYIISNLELFNHQPSGLVFLRDYVKETRRAPDRPLKSTGSEAAITETFRYLAGGGKVLWHAGQYDGSSMEFKQSVRPLGERTIQVPADEEGDLPWALFGGLDPLDGMNEPLVLQIAPDTFNIAPPLQPTLPLYNYPRMKRRTATTAKRLLLIGVIVDYINEDTLPEIRVYSGEETLLRQQLKAPPGTGNDGRHVYVLRVWLNNLHHEVRIENSSTFGGKFELDFLAYLGGGLPTGYASGKPTLNFGGTAEAELYSKQLATALHLMSNYLVDAKGGAHRSLPGGRYADGSSLDAGLMMGELACWGYLDEARALARQGMRSLGTETQLGSAGDVSIGNVSLLTGIYTVWRKLGRAPEFVSPSWTSSVQLPMELLIKEMRGHPLGLINSKGELGVRDPDRPGTSLPMFFATDAALQGGIAMAREAQRSETANRWQRETQSLSDTFRRQLVTDTQLPIVSEKQYPAAWGLPAVSGVVAALPPNVWIYGRYEDGSPVIYNNELRVFDTPYVFAGLPFRFAYHGYSLPDDLDSQIKATYEYLFSFSDLLFQTPNWHKHYIVDYRSSDLQLWTIMAGLLTDSAPISSRMLETYIRYNFDEFCGLPDHSPAERADIRVSPYALVERLMVAPDGDNAGGVYDEGNAQSDVMALTTARLIAGIDDYDAEELKLLPRLPENWQFVEADEWLITHNFGTRDVQPSFYRYEREAEGRYRLQLDCGEKLNAVTVRVGPFPPRVRRVLITNYDDQAEVPTIRRGLTAWAVKTYRGVKALDISARIIVH